MINPLICICISQLIISCASLKSSLFFACLIREDNALTVQLSFLVCFKTLDTRHPPLNETTLAAKYALGLLKVRVLSPFAVCLTFYIWSMPMRASCLLSACIIANTFPVERIWYRYRMIGHLLRTDDWPWAFSKNSEVFSYIVDAKRVPFVTLMLPEWIPSICCLETIWWCSIVNCDSATSLISEANQ